MRCGSTIRCCCGRRRWSGEEWKACTANWKVSSRRSQSSRSPPSAFEPQALSPPSGEVSLAALAGSDVQGRPPLTFRFRTGSECVAEQERYLLNRLADGRLYGGQVLRYPHAGAGDAEGSDGSASAQKIRPADANDPLGVLFVVDRHALSANFNQFFLQARPRGDATWGHRRQAITDQRLLEFFGRKIGCNGLAD